MVFMFTDVADSTRLKQPGALGAAAYAALAARHDAAFRSIVGAIPSAEILKDIGDGFMVVFATASDAVRAALRFQYALQADPGFAPAGAPAALRVRVGIHQGEVSTLDPDIHGKPKLIGPAADMAARLQSLALPSQVLVSRAAFNDARQYVREHPVCGESGARPLLHWDAHGHYRFKGIDDPQEVFEVGAEGFAPRQRPPDGEKARYVGSPDDEQVLGWRPATGQSIPGRDHWSLEKRLGVGGFCEAWLARRAKTHERRVFKFCFDADRLRSLRREVTLFRLLREAFGDRPDIARLHEFQLDRPPFFLESQYSELGDLTDWAESQGGIAALPLERRIEIVILAAEAVAAAHSVGILHKDIKPSNILMYAASDGTARPRLADFGIGILTDRTQLEGRGITAAGMTASSLTDNSSSRMGTRMYAPPELDAGKPFTMQGDVYALGVLLYQLVAGDFGRPLATGWERDITDDLLREDIAAATLGDLEQRLPAVSDLIERLGSLRSRRAARTEAEFAARREASRRRRMRWALAATALTVFVAGVASWALFKTSAALEETEASIRSLETYLIADDELRGRNNLLRRLRDDEQPSHGGRTVCFFHRPGSTTRDLVFLDDDGEVVHRLDPRKVIPSWVQATDEPEVTCDVVCTLLEDVLPTSGRELIVCMNDNDRHLGCIAIYNLDLRLISEVWHRGRIDSATWLSDAGILAVVAKGANLPICVPSLATYDSMGCDVTWLHPDEVFAIEPQNIRGVVGPLRGDAEHPPARIAWAFARLPDLANRRDFIQQMAISVRPPDRDYPQAVCQLLFTHGSGAARMHLCIDGSACEPYTVTRPSAPVEPTLLAVPSFQPIKLDAISRGLFIAQESLTATGSLNATLEAIHADASLSSQVREAATDAARAMSTNWRWLHGRAWHRWEARDPNQPFDFEMSFAMAREALRLHDERCANILRCASGWYPRRIIALLHYESGNHDAAIQCLQECERVWAADDRNPICRIAFHAAYLAMAHHQLGHTALCRKELERAETVVRNHPPPKGYDDVTEALERARALINGPGDRPGAR
jgi:class 3 adenylate cyclase/serine/threonine protein kinase